MFEDYSVQEPIAVWSSVRGVWETSQVSMLCGHSVPFLETWPIRGSMRSGRVYELPMSAHLMDGLGFSSSPSGVLLRTPVADEAGGGPLHPDVAAERGQTLRLSGQILAMTGDLLPTPVAQPSGNSPEDHLRKKPGRAQVTDLAIIVENSLLETGGRLLPTPNTMDMLPRRSDEALARAKAKGGCSNLKDVEIIRDPSEEWGSYEPAVKRWERVLGREAPAPTQMSARGKPQLAPAFVEWMMGLPEGWVTDVELSRNEMLRMLGNGVVPQQALRALELMG